MSKNEKLNNLRVAHDNFIAYTNGLIAGLGYNQDLDYTLDALRAKLNSTLIALENADSSKAVTLDGYLLPKELQEAAMENYKQQLEEARAEFEGIV